MSLVKVQRSEVSSFWDQVHAMGRAGRIGRLRCVVCGDRATAVGEEDGVFHARCEAHVERPGDIWAPFAPDWTGLAACADSPPKGTRGHAESAADYALRFCIRCPVADECAAYAVRSDHWLGLHDRESGLVRRQTVRPTEALPMAGLSPRDRAGLTEQEAIDLSRARLFELAESALEGAA